MAQPQTRGWISRVHSRAYCAALTALFAPMFLISATHLAQAQTFRAVYSFQDKKDGRNPQAGLFTDAIYGTTFLAETLRVPAEQSSSCFPLEPLKPCIPLLGRTAPIPQLG